MLRTGTTCELTRGGAGAPRSKALWSAARSTTRSSPPRWYSARSSRCSRAPGVRGPRPADRARRSPHRRAARRLLLSPAARGAPGAARRRSGAPARVRHARGDLRLRRRRARHHAAAAGPDRAGLAGGRVAVHPLPPAEALVETLFIRRRDAFVSSALGAFLRHIRPPEVAAEAADCSAIARTDGFDQLKPFFRIAGCLGCLDAAERSDPTRRRGARKPAPASGGRRSPACARRWSGSGSPASPTRR